MIRVSELTKNYGPVRAVDHVNFSIESGEVVGFLGPNGAGKTTTMKILTGYLVADWGQAEVAGMDVTENPIEVKRRTGYLPESTPLYTEMRVKDYLQFISQVREIPRHKMGDALDRVTDSCGLGGVMYKNISELSKGYRQRVGLAQALIHEPEVLILDEPTVGLDPNQIAEIRELIKRLGKEKTVILSTHVLSEVKAACARAIIIRNGRIVKDSRVADLTSSGQVIQLGWRAPLEAGKEALQNKLDRLVIAKAWEDGDRTRLELECPGGEEVCETIFALAAGEGWVISQLSRQETSLEEVFHELTREPAA